MSVESHIEQLRRKHAALDQKIQQAEKSPAPDEVTLHSLKREKLAIKDEISQLSH